MKKIFFIIIGILLLTGCNKEMKDYSELVFSVPEVNGTKTHLEPNAADRLFDVVWDEGDQVKVYDQDGGSGIYTNLNVYDDDNNEVAHFGGDGVDITSTMTAFYPVSIATSENKFTLPYEQTYRSRSNGYMVDYPMWGQETNNNHIWFRNLTGIVILRIRGQQGTVIRRVYLKDPADPIGAFSLRGTYSVTAQGSTHTHEPIVSPEKQYYDITLNCNSNPTTLTSNELSLFYFSIPGGTHSRLLVGLEYMLPNSTEWHTTYQLIFAQSYGKPTFKFERSKWTPIDIDFSNLDGSLLYSLNNINLNPNQSGDTVVNTGLPLTSQFGEYTFVIDITPDDISSTDDNGYLRKTIYSEMDNVSSNWNGILIRLAKQNNTGTVRLEVQVGSATSIFTTQGLNSGTRHQFVVTVSNYSNTQATVTAYFKRNNSVTSVNSRFQKTRWVTSSNPLPEIGGDQHIHGRYFDGEIHKFEIFEGVWSSSKINSFITQ